MGRRISRAARRYLITFQPEPYALGFEAPIGAFIGGRWGWQTSGTRDTIRHFATPVQRDMWVEQNPEARTAVGKRHPLVKAFRNKVEG